MEEKKAELYLVLSFIINFCVAFTLIWTVGILFILEVGGASKKECGSTAYKNFNPFEQLRAEDESSAQKTETKDSEGDSDIVSVDVNDNGFLSKGFQVNSSDQITIIFANKGAKAHSFVIDEMDIDSGAVESGQTKTITISNLPQENKVYNFYSGVNGDKELGFSGLMMVWD